MHENLELRPKTFDEFVGQEKIIKTLKVLLASAIHRKKMVDHILFYSPPGLGKTTLATLVAIENKANIKFIQGPLIEKKADLLTIFTSLSNNDILFIDEIHSINKNVEELLYSAMDEGVVDIPFGVEGEKKIIRMKLPNFTIFGATTKFSAISKPLKDRFGFIANLEPYTNSNIVTILCNSAKILKLDISKELISQIANYSELVPRKANNILKRIRDFSIYSNVKVITKSLVKETLHSIGIYNQGLTQQHILYLRLLKSVVKSNWVSLDTINSILHNQKENITSFIEPLLIQLNLIEKSFRGRRITQNGLQYLKEYDTNK